MHSAHPTLADPKELERHLTRAVTKQFPPGKKIDGFEVRGKLAQAGGMGLLFPVVDGFKREGLLKLLRPNLHARYSPPLKPAAMLAREAGHAALLASVDSDAFAQVYGSVGHVQLEVDDHLGHGVLELPYYVMQRLIGSNLEIIIASHQKRGALIPWNEVLSFVHHIAVALSIAHDHGIIHRDLKPNNIYVHRRAYRKSVVKLLDFGIAAEEGAQRLGSTGTARHMPPEFTDPNVTTESKTSDIYSFGLLIYEIAVLRGPFDDEVIGLHPLNRQREAFALAHRRSTPRPLSDFRADAPAQLVGLVSRMLQKRQVDRPDLPTVVDALGKLLGEFGAPPDSRLADMLDTVGTAAARREAQREHVSEDRPIISEVFHPAALAAEHFAVTAPLVAAYAAELPAQPVAIADAPSVRVFRSTAEVFDSQSVWDDDVYMASPFDRTDVDASPADPPDEAKDDPVVQNESMPGAVIVPTSAARVSAARRRTRVRALVVGLAALVIGAGLCGEVLRLRAASLSRDPGASPAAREIIAVSAAAAIAPAQSPPAPAFVPPPPASSTAPLVNVHAPNNALHQRSASPVASQAATADVVRSFNELGPTARVEKPIAPEAGASSQPGSLDDLNQTIGH